MIQDSMTHLQTFMVGIKNLFFLLILGTENIFDALHSLNCYAYCSV